MVVRDSTKNRVRQQSSGQAVVLRAWVWELLLTVFSLGLLLALAGQLEQGDRPLGLGQRYAGNDVQALPQDLAKPADIPFSNDGASRSESTAHLDAASPVIEKTLRAQWLNMHAERVLLVIVACGWIALCIGRGTLAARAKFFLIAAIWCMAAYLTGAWSIRWQAAAEVNFFQASVDPRPMLAGLLLLGALLSLPRANRNMRQPIWIEHEIASPWIFPGFVLFSGLGWIWLMDWAARGHEDKKFIGIYQLDLIWLAFTIFTLVAACQGQLLTAFSRVASRLDQPGATRASVPNLTLILFLFAWIVVLAAAGHLDAGTNGQVKIYQRHAALLAELMRVPVWLALGWILYRRVESGQRSANGMFAVASLLIVLASGLVLDHDGGPIFAQTIAVVWISCSMLTTVLERKMGAIPTWATAIAAAVAGTAASIWMAFLNAPAARVEAMANSYRGPLDFLSVTHWLLDAVPAFGFGIGRTPWCGFAALSGTAGQCRRAGVPDQIQSDYVVSALLALWGWLPVLLLLGALLLWLWELQRRGADRNAAVLDLGLFRQWIVLGFSVTSGVQIAVSAAGTLGVIPLTGLAIPMLSFGGAGLMSTALFSGLSVNRVRLKGSEIFSRAGPRSAHLAPARTRGFT
ncbi:MAG TPA: FtsW/RodA/SpoVE family cell cycle protein [Burkholderiaceae bacterium]